MDYTIIRSKRRTMCIQIKRDGAILVRVPLSYLFSLKEGATLVDIGLAVPAATVYGIVFFGVCYLLYLKDYKKNHEK